MKTLNKSTRALFVCLLCAGLIVLGTWQVYRHFFKVDIKSYVQFALNLPVLEYNCTHNHDNKLVLKYRRVEIQGTPLCEKLMYLYSPNPTDSKEVGYQIILPITCKGGQNKILVDAGWIPEKFKGKNDLICNANEKNKSFTIQGVAVPSISRNYFTPDNDYKNNMLYNVNINEIENHLNIDLGDLYVISSGGVKGGQSKYPIGRNFVPHIFNEHLRYAFMWYAISMIIMILYYVASRKEE